MAKVVEVELVAKTDKAVAGVNKVEKAVEKTASTTRKASKELSGLEQAGGAALGALDRQTGGLASKLVGVAKAAKLSGKAMKTALISSGIGAAVVAIGLLVEYWDEIKGLVDGVGSEQKALLKTTEDTLAAQQEQLAITGSMENSLKLQGKTDKEIRDLKRQQTDEIIASTELLLEQQKEQKKAQIEAAERNQNITKGIIAFLSLPLTMLLGLIDGITNSLAKLGIIDEGTKLTEGYLDFASSMLFDPEEVAESGEETIKATEETLRKLKNTRDGYLLQDKKDKEKKKEEAKPDKVEVDPEVAAKAKALEEIAKLEDDYIQSQLDKKIAEENLVSDKYFNLIEQAKKYNQDTALLEEAQASELAAINKKYKDQEEKDEKIKRDAQLNMAKNTLGDISSLFDKQSAASKAAAAAAALINTYQGITAELATKTVTPFEFGLKIANIAATAAIGFKSVKDILKTSPSNARGGTNPASGASGGSQAPAFNVVGSSGETQLADAIGGQSQRPARAYVVSNDVTTAQELDRNIIEGASIG